ncbi:MAG: hypothetical protein ABIO57_01665 [Candidatus Paceibacterota bacterium]
MQRHLGERQGVDKEWVGFAQAHWAELPGEGTSTGTSLTVDTSIPVEDAVMKIAQFLK